MRVIISILIALVTIFISSFLIINNGLNKSKSVNFSEDIAPILYDNCTVCHHNGGIAPFSLVSYNDAYSNRTMMEYMTVNGYMPPWPPDTTFSRFSHERILSANDISMIQSWVAAGAPQGDSTLAPPYPTYNNNTGPTLGTPDLTISAPVYTSNAVNHDDYVCFVIPSGITQSRKIRAVEISPGNTEIVHHCIVYLDTSGTFQTDTSGHCMGPTYGKIVGEYAPGSNPTIFPGDSNLAFAVDFEAGCDVILTMHYPYGTLGMVDSTKVHFYFYPETYSNFRTLSIQPVISNFNFCIPANTVQSFNAEFPTNGTTIPGNWSVYGIFPHMHLIGQSIQCLSVDGTGDTLPLINIPAWDFEWQGFYKYPFMQKIESGSVVKATASYDNTSNNPHNPNDPPQLVCAGLNTTDEMFLVFFLFTSYYPGDEFLNMDSLAANSGLNILENNQTSWQVAAYPNPLNDQVRFAFNLDIPTDVSLQVMDLNGKIIFHKDYGHHTAGAQQITYNVHSFGDTPPGVYLYYLKAGEKRNFGKIIIQ